MKIGLKYLFLFFLLVGCNQKNEKDYVAVFNNDQISLKQIDNTIKLELYDHIYAIYELRKIALDEIIRKKAVSENENDYYISIDSIYKKYNVEINISEPISPSFIVDDKDIFYKGNMNGDKTLILIKNFDCDNCRVISMYMEKLFEIYKDRIKFGYINYSEPNLSSKALEFAKKKDLYNQLFDVFNNYRLIMDSTYIYDQISNLGLSKDEFDKYINTKESDDDIFENYIKISERGIRRVPTILLNNQLLNIPNTFEEFEKDVSVNL
ncbi:thioredoxin domain-containing protein [Bacteroides sp. 519]|uniref:DsbA family protein n=1 Tax=Bacteroides sp. 519 TaxID=2302937 RepID=UPI0013D3321F|nr:thioredoxin domain-containing protein [Bacteroides sp. 519]NDV60127.1 hypothetical protein [Bacteroides sp. 519]